MRHAAGRLHVYGLSTHELDAAASSVKCGHNPVAALLRPGSKCHQYDVAQCTTQACGKQACILVEPTWLCVV